MGGAFTVGLVFDVKEAILDLSYLERCGRHELLVLDTGLRRDLLCRWRLKSHHWCDCRQVVLGTLSYLSSVHGGHHNLAYLGVIKEIRFIFGWLA